MSETLGRNGVAALAKSDSKAALAAAVKIVDPWFRSQALSHVARYSAADAPKVAELAAAAARECIDAYQRSAVRAWEIAALAEAGSLGRAKTALHEALAEAKNAEPASSRAESLFLLFQAIFPHDNDAAAKVLELLRATCPPTSHWRCKRALRDAQKILDGVMPPRPFYW